MSRLIKSAKFWTLVIDAFVTLITLWGGIYFEAQLPLILGTIAAIQPVFIALIKYIAEEDKAHWNALEIASYQARLNEKKEQPEG